MINLFKVFGNTDKRITAVSTTAARRSAELENKVIDLRSTLNTTIKNFLDLKAKQANEMLEIINYNKDYNEALIEHSTLLKKTLEKIIKEKFGQLTLKIEETSAIVDELSDRFNMLTECVDKNSNASYEAPAKEKMYLLTGKAMFLSPIEKKIQEAAAKGFFDENACVIKDGRKHFVNLRELQHISLEFDTFRIPMISETGQESNMIICDAGKWREVSKFVLIKNKTNE